MSVAPDVCQCSLKYDDGKRRWDKFPWLAAGQVMEVLEYGADKYEWDNWQKGMAWTRLWSAVIRHMLAWLGGERCDPESGLPHLAHAATDIMFMITYEIGGGGDDDRKRTEPSAG